MCCKVLSRFEKKIHKTFFISYSLDLETNDLYFCFENSFCTSKVAFLKKNPS